MLTVVYGISANTRAFLESPYNTGNLIYASTPGNELYNKLKVYSLEELATFDKEQITRIVICSQYLSEIVTALLEINFPFEKLFFFDHGHAKLKPVSQLCTPFIDETSVLFAIYDLRECLPTYDFMNFCVLAEIERKKQNKKHLSLIIVPNRSSSTKEKLLSPFHSNEEYDWRVSKILLGIVDCLPSINGVQILRSAQAINALELPENSVFPKNAHINARNSVISTSVFHQLPKNTNFSVFKAPKQASQLAQLFIDSHNNNKRVITITLREYAIHSDRNSDIKEWALFLNSLDLDEYFPVIIRDTETCTQPLPSSLKQFATYPIAAIDFPSRVAMYENAWLNLAVSNGPTFIFNYLPNCHSITFMKLDESNPAISSDTFKKAGVTPGKHYPFRDNDLQHLIWEPATYKNIKYSFNQLVEQKIKAGYK